MGLLCVAALVVPSTVAQARQALAPAVTVHEEPHQLGGYIHTYGSGFTPGGRVDLYVEGLRGQHGRIWKDFLNARQDGNFTKVTDVRCVAGQPRSDAATWVAVDSTTRAEATARVYSMSCG